jgi:hypothetical protein
MQKVVFGVPLRKSEDEALEMVIEHFSMLGSALPQVARVTPCHERG